MLPTESSTVTGSERKQYSPSPSSYLVKQQTNFDTVQRLSPASSSEDRSLRYLSFSCLSLKRFASSFAPALLGAGICRTYTRPSSVFSWRCSFHLPVSWARSKVSIWFLFFQPFTSLLPTTLVPSSNDSVALSIGTSRSGSCTSTPGCLTLTVFSITST